MLLPLLLYVISIIIHPNGDIRTYLPTYNHDKTCIPGTRGAVRVLQYVYPLYVTYENSTAVDQLFYTALISLSYSILLHPNIWIPINNEMFEIIDESLARSSRYSLGIAVPISWHYQHRRSLTSHNNIWNCIKNTKIPCMYSLSSLEPAWVVFIYPVYLE